MIYTLKFAIDFAHRTREEKNLHGHTWLCRIQIKLKEDDKFDFRIIEKIHEQLNEKVILQVGEENKDIVYMITKICGSKNLFLLHDDPTRENMAKIILDTLEIENKNAEYKVKLTSVDNKSVEVQNILK